ncbi:inositol hexakisphosphate kinase 3-like [Amia ocellicauda]|uniref:inositol hexakisphosphate kinase 3-like n=1 Tax=Amia ocellicauda TaxID=2972642 RepID=UPI003463EFF0
MVGGEPRVRLEPFTHQVGGHTGMMRYDETTVCKPLCSRELSFYQALPPDMQPFTPRYKGLVSVWLERDSGGNLALVAGPHNDNNNHSQSQHPLPPPAAALRHKRSKTERQLARDGPLMDRACKDRLVGCRWGGSLGSDVPFHAEDANGNDDRALERNRHNPWALHCHRAQLSRMVAQGPLHRPHRFVLLENVAWPFEQPCVLDLKMGTRQHGDDASEDKRRRHTQRCQQSTSASLGLWLGGMQVFQVTSGHFLCRNKYYGRGLSGAGLRQALCQFLHDGQRLRRVLIGPVLRRLRQLRAVIQRMGSCRFYSSSLLLIYEGVACPPPAAAATTGDQPPLPPPLVDVRMIDFAHTTFHGSSHTHSPAHSGPDSGYIFGMENLIAILQEIHNGQ